MKTNYSIFIVVLSAFVMTLQAQTTYDDMNNHVYQSIATIYPSDLDFYGPGYAIASTNASNAGNEIIRTDPAGNILWEFRYDEINNLRHRFTHIEKYINMNTNRVEYLVVGSIDQGSTSTLTLTRLDEFGAISANGEFSPNVSTNFLTGIKGIYASNGEFVIVGLESTGFTPSDQKQILVMGVDINITTISFQHFLSSTGNVNDYDMVTDIIETSPGQYAIVGTANENSFTTSEPAAMAAVVDNTTTIVGQYIFATTPPGTGHADNAASVVYDGTDLWILGNSSAQHYFHLTQMDATLVTLKAPYMFFDPEYDKYGFDLDFSLANPGHLVIAGYEYTYNSSLTNEAYPFLVEFDPISAIVNWQFVYKTSNPGITSFIENPLLYLTALGQFGYFYNDILDRRYDNNGYTFLGNDDLLSGSYGIKLWGVDVNGILPDPNCGMNDFPIGVNDGDRYLVNSLTLVTPAIGGPTPFLAIDPYNYSSFQCGPLSKKGNQSEGIAELTEKASRGIYPNPASDVLNITGYEEATHIIIHDLSGKLMLNQKLETPAEATVLLSHLNVGIYTLKIMKEEEQLAIEKLQVNR